MYRKRGITSCTVSSIEMAEYFAEDKWIDITVAFPLNYLEADRINALASQIKLNLLVSVPEVIPNLTKKLKNHIGIFIEVDTGYHRTGVFPDDINTFEKIFDEIQASNLLKFVGFLSHAGHTYKCSNANEVEKIHRIEVQIMNDLKRRYASRYPDLILSIGDTPSASIVRDFSGVDEIRPGNLVFYDLTQCQIGSCSLDQIAIALICPVVATYPKRNEIVVYGGGVHFSKDFLVDKNGQISYGKIVKLAERGWELPPTNMFVKSLSQEHGIIHSPDGSAEDYKPGDLLGVLPVHSCMMANAMGNYVTTDGEAIADLFNP